MSEAATFKEVQDNINELTCKVSTLQDLGKLFTESDALCLSGCVIEDYSGVCLSLIEQLEDQICSLKKQSDSFDAMIVSSLQVSPAAHVQ